MQEWAIAAHKKGKPTGDIPKVYQWHAKVFLEVEAKCFTPSRPEDQVIKLKEGASDTMNCKVYPLTKAEWEATQKFIQENEELKYIEKSDSPWATPWFFIKKKDGSLGPIQDYRTVNAWTIQDSYLIPRIEQILE